MHLLAGAAVRSPSGDGRAAPRGGLRHHLPNVVECHHVTGFPVTNRMASRRPDTKEWTLSQGGLPDPTRRPRLHRGGLAGGEASLPAARPSMQTSTSSEPRPPPPSPRLTLTRPNSDHDLTKHAAHIPPVARPPPAKKAEDGAILAQPCTRAGATFRLIAPTDHGICTSHAGRDLSDAFLRPEVRG
jgi:hypothetical protein